MTKYDANDHYVCTKSGVLKNKLNITNPEELNDAESTMTAFRSLHLKNKPIKGNFDLKHLQAIHKYLFKEIYSWAGNIRNVDLAKSGSYFANHVHIESAANSLLENLHKETFTTLEHFVERAAYYLGELNAIHPFREGNGRAQREFINHLAYKHGYLINWANVSQEEMLQASVESFLLADHSKLYQIILNNTQPSKY